MSVNFKHVPEAWPRCASTYYVKFRDVEGVWSLAPWIASSASGVPTAALMHCTNGSTGEVLTIDLTKMVYGYATRQELMDFVESEILAHMHKSMKCEVTGEPSWDI